MGGRFLLKKILLTAAGACLLLSSALFADHHRYVNHMKAVAKNMKPTNVALQSGDMDTVRKNANMMANHFASIGAWWEGRGSEAAAKISDEAHDAAVELRKAAVDKNAEAAKAAMGKLGGTCKSCHSAHRTKNEDGTFGFKN